MRATMPDSAPAGVGTRPGGDRLFVNSLARGLAVLGAFSRDKVKMSAGDLARSTGLPKATITRLTHTLMTLGYLSVCEDSGKFQLHPRILSLGYPVLASVDRRYAAGPLMQELADASGGTVSLGLRDGLGMIFVERSRHRTVRALPLDIGSKLPLECTAMGRAYFAAADRQEQQAILALYRDSVQDRADAIEASLEDAVDEYARQGYCKAVGTWESDVNAVGVAVSLSSETRAAFNCGGPASVLPEAGLDALGERLREMAGYFESAEWVGQLPGRRYRGAES